jgi:hypothetical protein
MPGLAIDVTLTGNAPDAVRSLRAGLHPSQLNPIVGRAARTAYRDHLFGLNSQRPNALGGARTNFYADAARATQFRVEGDHVIVSINQVGIALRFFGGTVKPRTAKFLTIPVHPRAHGHRAREFDLELVYGRNGEPIALATKSSLVNIVRQTAKGRITRNLGGRRGEIMFRLVRSATMKPDETVLPYPQQVGAAAARAVDTYAKLLWERSNPPRSGGAN